MNMFLNTEFTGLHKYTTLISLALIDEKDNIFYAEFKDYDKTQVDEWIQENVIDNLLYNNLNENYYFNDDKNVFIFNNTTIIIEELKRWLYKYENNNEYIEIWGDRLSFDWVLFTDLFGSIFNLPRNIFNTPFDINTLFKIKDINVNINREDFIEDGFKDHKKFNALYNVKIIKKCYEKLITM